MNDKANYNIYKKRQYVNREPKHSRREWKTVHGLPGEADNTKPQRFHIWYWLIQSSLSGGCPISDQGSDQVLCADEKVSWKAGERRGFEEEIDWQDLEVRYQDWRESWCQLCHAKRFEQQNGKLTCWTSRNYHQNGHMPALSRGKQALLPSDKRPLDQRLPWLLQPLKRRNRWNGTIH